MVKNYSKSVWVAGWNSAWSCFANCYLTRVSMDTNVWFSVLPECFPDKFWIFFRKMSRIDLSLSVSGGLKNKISNDKLCNKVFKNLFSWKFTMDLSENGKCLFTSLQYVESSHAPYQRIRFFYFFINKIHNMRQVYTRLQHQIEEKNLKNCRLFEKNIRFSLFHQNFIDLQYNLFIISCQGTGKKFIISSGL
jgi:hypothetical protein